MSEDEEVELPDGYTIEPFEEDDLAPEGTDEDCAGGEDE